MCGINIINVSKKYELEDKNIVVLNNINLNIDENKITVILGRSGCGKTTLLRILGGLEKCDCGKIEHNNIKSLAYVFQEPRLMPWLNVEKNIKFGLNKKQVDDDKIKEIINIVGLSSFEKANPQQLSGGMQQRVSIARALAFEPSFILMDEPFSALDYFTREQMQNELLKIRNKSNCGILFVTHSIDEAIRLGDKIIILEDGNIKDTFIIEENQENRNLLEQKYILIKQEILNKLKI